MKRRIVRRVAILALLPPVSATGVEAQACLGHGSTRGEYAAAGRLGLDDASKIFGLEGVANLTSPFALRARYELEDFDATEGHLHSARAEAALDLTERGGWALCPTAGVGYGRLIQEASEGGLNLTATLERVFVPVGFAVARRFPVGSEVSLAPYATPRFRIVREEFEITVDGERAEESDTGWDGYTDIGVLVDGGRVYGSVSTGVRFPSGDPPVSEPSVRLKAGVTF